MSEKRKLHPIQIQGIKVRELFVRNNAMTDDSDELSGDFEFKVGHTEFNAEESSIDVGLVIVMGKPEDPDSDELLDLKVHLHAKFSIDVKLFPVDKIEHWAVHNAPLILYPYAREQVYALTGRTLKSPILLPLLQVPTVRVE